MFVRLKTMKLKNKLYLLVLLQATLFFVFASYFNLILEKEMMQKLTEHNSKVNSKMATYLRYSISDAKQIFETTLAYENSTVMKNLEQLISRMNHYENINVNALEVERTWTKYFRENPQLLEVAIHSYEGQAISKNSEDMYVIISSTPEDKEWIQLAMEKRGDYVVLRQAEGVSVIKSIIYPSKYEKMGVMKVEVDLYNVEEFFQNNKMFPGQQHGLFFNSEYVAGEMDISFEQVEQIISQQKENDSIYFDKQNKRVYLISQNNRKDNIVSISSIPYSEVFGDALMQNMVFLVAVAVYIMFSFFVITLVVRSILSSLKVFEHAFTEIESGDFGKQIDIPVEEELQGFLTAYNRMTVHLDELIWEVYEKNIAQRTLELQLLRSQINPHFFYNTLEALRMNCEKGQEQYNKKIIECLSTVLRYGLAVNDKPVLVSDEMHHLESYVMLHNLRSDAQVELQILVPPNLMHRKVIKLLFQPLLENSIQHGMSPGAENLVVQIMGYTSGEEIIFTVADNGTGIPENRLEALKQSLQGKTIEEKVGIGVKNVHRRLQLYYGLEYGLSLRSVYGQGTEITITLPAYTEPSYKPLP